LISMIPMKRKPREIADSPKPSNCSMMGIKSLPQKT
jgi:hypothetical protein